LAERTAAYAKTIDSPTPTSPAVGAGGTGVEPKPSSVEFATPSALAGSTDGTTPPTGHSPLTITSNVAPGPAVPPDPRAAVIASAVRHSPASDTPVTVADGAEFDTRSRAADPLGVRLAKRAKANPTDPLSQFDYQNYLMLSGGSDAGEPLLNSTAGLPADERDVIAGIIDGISNFRSSVAADPNQTPTQQLRPMQDMLDHLRSGADLSVGTVALCKRVTGFGLYDPIAPARFPRSRSSTMYLYCEVDNFQPHHEADGRWQTLLKQQVSLLTAAGTVVWEDKARPVKDVCRNRRRDFFTCEPVTLPPTLAPGSYRMRVSVTDLNANKVAESDAPLWVEDN
jgi:hypothetical protein